MKTIDLVVPCYNEEEGLEHFVEETNKVIDTLPEYYFRYILINDGSKDKTYLVMKRLAARFDNIKYISFSRNFGKEAAMYAGLQHCDADYVVVMDADLQHPPAVFPQMLEAMNEGYDCCATKRDEREGESFFRGAFSKLFFRLSNRMTDVKNPYGAMDYRMMTRQMVDSILELGEVQRFSKGIFSWVGFNTKWITFKTVDRELAWQVLVEILLALQVRNRRYHLLLRHTAAIHGGYGRDNLFPLPHLYHRNADSDSVLRNPDPGLRHHPLRSALSRRTDRNVDRYSRRIHRQDLHGVKGQTDLHYKVL